ncbi:methyltransferase family protein [Mycobacterium kansasii]
MDDLLDALRVKDEFDRKFMRYAIWIGFPLAMVGVAGCRAVFESAFELSMWLVLLNVTVVWLLWTFWHSVIFEWHRKRFLSHGDGYRRAFIVDIFPGVTIGFSQMLRPSFNGINMSCNETFPKLPRSVLDIAEDALGILVAIGAFALFVSAWRTLGTARVGFVCEFCNPVSFVPIQRGPYARVRHPLFWSGIGLSWACAILSGPTMTAAAIAMLNAGYGIVYNELEDRRLKRVFGDRYAGYAREVPHISPWGFTSRPLQDEQAVGKRSRRLLVARLRAS